MTININLVVMRTHRRASNVDNIAYERSAAIKGTNNENDKTLSIKTASSITRGFLGNFKHRFYE